jgi:hypothetical protein
VYGAGDIGLVRSLGVDDGVDLAAFVSYSLLSPNARVAASFNSFIAVQPR